MNFLTLNSSWLDISQQPFEIVERKGLGHPDTLADGLADAISIAYSRYCLGKFGVVLHHNLDKVYIGGGHFTCDYGSRTMLAPIKVVVNGRISNTMDGLAIDVRAIQKDAVVSYLKQLLPHLDTDEHLDICPNATQHTQRNHWFSPRSIEDLPEQSKLTANDTSLCVAYAPLSTCELLSIALEQTLWVVQEDGRRIPRWPDIGQDIKVMILRNGNRIDVTLCVPFISNLVNSHDYYQQRVREIEATIQDRADSIAGKNCRISVQVNTAERLYMLGVGSCIECGEEGIVGRGNSSGGFIAAGRPHSMEAAFGKNPVYHTGRVLGYLTQKLAWAIYRETGSPNVIHSLTTNGGNLIPPDRLIISTATDVPRSTIVEIIERDFLAADYLSEILMMPSVFRALDFADNYLIKEVV
ncbi:hypothetical protein KJ836_02065 [Patescibacteria group bacterium]|nr:hypothetical protein [Patescibacteria group bacterium]